VPVRGIAFNPGTEAQTATLRFEQYDYTGTRRLADPIDHAISIPPGESVVVEQAISLIGRGLVIARVSVLQGDTLVHSSDQPLTALAFPKAATKHDNRERFGASFRSKHLAQAGQKIGLAWTRWYPHFNWATVQKDGPDSWAFPDETCEQLWAMGIAPTAVLHSTPKWAEGDGKSDKHLAKDMQWPADDPRWADLDGTVTDWDRYIVTLVTHYHGKPMVYEFANEPDIGKWDSDIYFALAKRTYQLIKRTDPAATMLVNETWPGVRGWTRSFAKKGGLDAMDGHSFHNYSPGHLATPGSMNDLRQLFRSYGDTEDRTEIWFNEGWMYVPTSIDYPAPPIIDMTAPEAAHVIVRSATMLFSEGLDKFITFHIGYGGHGKSWWDWVGSGTEWWDDHGNPTVAVGAYNGLCHFLGLSQPVQHIEAEQAELHVFDDLRNNRGVAVIWATANQVTLAIDTTELSAFDVMGNPLALPDPKQLALPTTGHPIYLVGLGDGTALAQRLAHLQVQKVDDGAFRVPEQWIGTEVRTSAGNPAMVDGAERWRFDQIWPDDPLKAENYKPLIWNGTTWVATDHSHGGQPAGKVTKGVATLTVRSPWNGNNGQKLSALSFIAPEAGSYRLSVDPALKNWDGKRKSVDLRLLHVNADGIVECERISVADGSMVELRAQPVTLAAGDRLVLVPAFSGLHIAGNLSLKNLHIIKE
jgi:hypothetical protein